MDAIGKLGAAINTALADPGVRTRLTQELHLEIPDHARTPAALGAFQKAEIEKWWPIIRAANIKAE
jgi:tripartite-type tricarboxylate transporter receptor subunit TctC